MPLRSALQHPAGKARRHQRQPSERLATTNMLTPIGLCGELFHVASGSRTKDVLDDRPRRGKEPTNTPEAKALFLRYWRSRDA